MISAAQAAEPITLKEMGSFHVGGKLVEISGKPVKEVALTPGGVPAKIDPNGTYQTGQMYVQYFIPQDQHGAYPLLMWHGGGLTGVTYETTPDGREGWLNYFLHRGWAVYNSDAVERGRAGWSQYPDIYKSEPVFLTNANPWERFRIGDGAGSFSADPAKRKLLPGSQFPAEAYDQFFKQNVPRWTTNNEATLGAYSAEIEKVCPCVIMVHSQAGEFGFEMAQKHPDLVKALIAVEPAAVPKVQAPDKLANTPVLMIYGDYIEGDKRWPTMRQRGTDFAQAIRDAGGTVDVVNLPEKGIKGNSHMIMMDKNSDQVAGLIQEWLADKKLYK
ncbi:esterase [Mangrovicella endophytica]|uniref:esterase n=1 Tax=Mangrovicella endophytica TaxID=2066697 RepID=UPI001FDF39C3|nr:esterase [Mangrovicella endophytica]